MMTSSNGNIFRVTGHLCGELTGLRWIPRTKQGRIQDLKLGVAQMDFENLGGGGGVFFLLI